MDEYKPLAGGARRGTTQRRNQPDRHAGAALGARRWRSDGLLGVRPLRDAVAPRAPARRRRRRGRAVQVVPIKPTLKAPGIKRLKLIRDVPLSIFAFKFNLRRYDGGLVRWDIRKASEPVAGPC